MKQWENQFKFILAAILTVVFILGSVGTAGASAGVLLMVQGDVTVISNDGDRPAKTGSPLMPGDVVESGGGKVTVLLSDGTLRTVNPGNKLVVPSPSAAQKGEKLLSRLVDTVRETTRKGQGPTIKGMVRGPGEITPVFPTNSFVERKALRFEWEPLKEGGTAAVEIKTRKPSYRHSIPVEAGSQRVRFPENAPPLDADVRYYWKVKTENNSGAGPAQQSKLSWFAILPSERVTTLASELDRIRGMEGIGNLDRQLLEAHLLIDYQLYHRAEMLLKNARVKAPADTGLKALLKGVYTEMKRTEAIRKLN